MCHAGRFTAEQKTAAPSATESPNCPNGAVDGEVKSHSNSQKPPRSIGSVVKAQASPVEKPPFFVKVELVPTTEDTAQLDKLVQPHCW